MSVHFTHSLGRSAWRVGPHRSLSLQHPGFLLESLYPANAGLPRRSPCMGRFQTTFTISRGGHTLRAFSPVSLIAISRAGMLSPAFTFVAGSVLLCPANRRLFALVPLVCRGNFSPHFALSGFTDRTQKKNSRKSILQNFRESHIGKLICTVECHPCRGLSVTNVGQQPYVDNYRYFRAGLQAIYVKFRLPIETYGCLCYISSIGLAIP